MQEVYFRLQQKHVLWSGLFAAVPPCAQHGLHPDALTYAAQTNN